MTSLHEKCLPYSKSAIVPIPDAMISGRNDFVRYPIKVPMPIPRKVNAVCLSMQSDTWTLADGLSSQKVRKLD
jgi:hypothetical protein